jgi:predicted PurR-regulated permease PerM
MTELPSNLGIARSGPTPERWRPLTPWALFLTLLFFYVLFKVRLVVEIGLLAFLYATVIERPVRRLGRHGVPRAMSIILVDLAIVAGLVLPILAIAPAASREIDAFRRDEPDRLRELDQQWATSGNPLLSGPGRDVLERAITELEAPPSEAPPKAVLSALGTTALWIIAGLACLMMAYFYMLEKDLLRMMLLENVPPRSRLRIAGLWDAVEESIGGWLRSRLILGVIVGIVSTIVFGLMGLPYWPLLGLLAGLTEPIPIIGPWIGGVPAVFLALTVSPLLAVAVVGFILARQMVVDAVIVPKVTKDAVGLSPLTVFAAVLAGTELLGPEGALLAIPLAAVVQIVVVDALAVRRGYESRPTLRWRWLSNQDAAMQDGGRDSSAGS